MERTFVAIKPDAIERGFIGEIISRIEKKGFKIVGLKMMMVNEETAKKHYAEHIGKPFFQRLVDFIISGPIVAMVVEGENVVSAMRKTMGSTSPQDAEPGTIRADFASTKERNIIHGSDSLASAEREIAIFFDENELLSNWSRDVDKWIME